MHFAYGQQADKKKLTIIRTASPITIDGELKESDWKNAPVANHFIGLRPTPLLRNILYLYGLWIIKE